jgi:hypothetical protein
VGCLLYIHIALLVRTEANGTLEALLVSAGLVRNA